MAESQGSAWNEMIAVTRDVYHCLGLRHKKMAGAHPAMILEHRTASVLPCCGGSCPVPPIDRR